MVARLCAAGRGFLDQWDEDHCICEVAPMNRIFALSMIAAAAVAAPALARAAGEDAKWFVLRQDSGATCWTARLISVNGEYASGTAQKAGGPFDTQTEAEARVADLRTRGVCRAE
jgi:hypothetical protein